MRLLDFDVGGMLRMLHIVHRKFMHNMWLGEIVVASVTILDVSITKEYEKSEVYFFTRLR